MTKSRKKVLNELSKEQLIYLIEQLEHSLHLISLTCVSESKMELKSNKAVEKIREYIYSIPSLYDAKKIKAFIDMKMEKISIEEYRKVVGLD